jgi:predicted TIM-barrel fold metal-dependent hydrolase
MYIIDFHVHVAKFDMWNPWVHEYMKRINPVVYRNFDVSMTPISFLKFMKEEDIDFAVVLAEDSPLTTGIVPNEFVAEFCQRNERLIPFASINPVLEATPAKKLASLVENLGMRGLKLLPSYQFFYPNDERLYPLYLKAEELGIPVNFQTGSSILKNTRLKYADPMYLDEVAVDFPDLKIIMAHGGRSFWYDVAFFLVKRHKNVYIDVSGLPPSNLLEYFPGLEEIGDRVVFGSDWPSVVSIKRNAEAIWKLPLEEETKRKILGENARKILKL